MRRATSRPRIRGVRAELIQAALAARERAHAPYSGYAVGAALRTREGRIFTGCNVENSSYGLSICAERVAATKAVSEGETEFAAIAIVTPSSPPGPPCGACRQFLEEFSPQMEVILADPQGEVEVTTLAKLLPHPFDRSFL